jgi:hypothetical protein
MGKGSLSQRGGGDRFFPRNEVFLFLARRMDQFRRVDGDISFPLLYAIVPLILFELVCFMELCPFKFVAAS